MVLQSVGIFTSRSEYSQAIEYSMRDTACEYSTNDSCNWLDIYEYAFFFLEYASVFPEIFLRAFFVMNILNIPQS